MTTPFGSGTGDEGYSNTTSEKSKDNTGSCVIVNENQLCINIYMYNIQRIACLKKIIFK